MNCHRLPPRFRNGAGAQSATELLHRAVRCCGLLTGVTQLDARQPRCHQCMHAHAAMHCHAPPDSSHALFKCCEQPCRLQCAMHACLQLRRPMRMPLYCNSGCMTKEQHACAYPLANWGFFTLWSHLLASALCPGQKEAGENNVTAPGCH